MKLGSKLVTTNLWLVYSGDMFGPALLRAKAEAFTVPCCPSLQGISPSFVFSRRVQAFVEPELHVCMCVCVERGGGSLIRLLGFSFSC